ncbi:MAG: RagB/SusD family nutrient uptake outer membrane protein [Sphingobacteriaceae bacterium]|nr:RagB/SusD family nutrient uptake outer membrane protein [Sphingobacteriaceae bacterium]
MKLQNIQRFFITTAVLLSISSCTKDFLNVEPKGTALESNYYRNEGEAYTGLVAIYDKLLIRSGVFDNTTCFFNSGSDDHYAGGGGATDGIGLQTFDNYSITSTTISRSLWNGPYEGINRANILLQKLPAVPMDAAKKARFTAEAKALRGYYYFELVRMFKNVPLILVPLVSTSDMYNVTQAKPEDVYAQVEKDLNEAIADLPATIANPATEAGRFTKGTVQALLGKVYLYDNKKDLAAAQLAAVNGTPGGTSQYGYKLLANFADLWKFDNKFNTESIMEVSHTSKSDAGWGNAGSGSAEGNYINVMVGPRNYSKVDPLMPDYASGWSFNVITQNLYDAMKLDPRFSATIEDLKALKAAGKIKYEAGYKDTGYFLKKFMPTKADVTKGGGDAVLNYQQNTYTIRLADTYLMEAEALGATGARAQALLDAVRARVGLPSVPVSMNAIMAERRMELAGEGHRWFDLVRTASAATVLAGKGFQAGKNEILPIPLKELENTKLVQNPNY